MGELKVKQIKNILTNDLSHLMIESKQAGFRFIERLVSDYQTEKNTFNHEGEALFGVFKGEVLIAIGGINIDPFSNDPHIGRLRRFYVAEAYRRNGVGSLLLHSLITKAKQHFKVLVLHTDTVEADQFYCSIGFCRESFVYPDSTHYLKL